MGRLYNNQKTIGYYHGSYVTVNYSDTKEVAKYDGGLITVNGHYVATCDENGYIYSEQNKSVALAKCEDGCVKDLNKGGYNVIAYYDGDMYGAAAAVAALILHLGSESTASTSNSESVQTDSGGSSGSSTGGSSEGGSSVITVIIGLALALVGLIWLLFPAIPIVLFILLGTLPLACVAAVLVIIGTVLLFMNKKSPTFSKTVISQLLLNAAWIATPILFGPTVMWAAGAVIAICRMIFVIIKFKKPVNPIKLWDNKNENIL